jgi:predicted restriction endonuclease
LIGTYYPDKFIPVRAEGTIDEYLKAIGFSVSASTSIAYKSHTLIEWKKDVPEFDEWDSFMLMKFCDWLWRDKKKIDGKKLTQDHLIKRANQISDEIDSLQLEGETKNAIVKVRVNQGEFRERLLHRYNKCCLCGVSESSFLIASHIKPWSVSNPIEKLDINNGFLMCPNHDKLFDQGYISFSDSGNILISPYMRDVDKIFMNVNDNMKIEIADKNKAYLAYHRDNIYLS